MKINSTTKPNTNYTKNNYNTIQYELQQKSNNSDSFDFQQLLNNECNKLKIK